MMKKKKGQPQNDEGESVPLDEYIQLTKGQSISRGMKVRKEREEG